MRILIVEDNQDKKDAIVGFISSLSFEFDVTTRESLSSGLQEVILNSDVDFIILDMSMPTFDFTDEEAMGGGAESFAGKEFLEQLFLRGVNIPVVVLSQFGLFGKGSSSKSLKSLDDELKEKFSQFYLGAIYYNVSMDEWKQELKNLLVISMKIKND